MLKVSVLLTQPSIWLPSPTRTNVTSPSVQLLPPCACTPAPVTTAWAAPAARNPPTVKARRVQTNTGWLLRPMRPETGRAFIADPFTQAHREGPDISLTETDPSYHTARLKAINVANTIRL